MTTVLYVAGGWLALSAATAGAYTTLRHLYTRRHR
ncbi:hypothetical protein BG846_03997 [Streptomyces fradiae ATCC 10745 = DSM 40063]|uniref:Uncharacterized protein n=1 Tax=Streptomyces fradiae ATCC 10745 = DSM 40063 TaxID=1319510 RepID=A0A1Y2NT52_STRFR|nr:hypothetical protein BG846_03997 [Streptomyces fradiae ATCC 10745 = DSM 40063]